MMGARDNSVPAITSGNSKGHMLMSGWWTQDEGVGRGPSGTLKGCKNIQEVGAVHCKIEIIDAEHQSLTRIAIKI